eukprot:TRINITY_DN2466_c1_g1_i4.p1 TRINITY_DN2466_c1_g1~~TRINITY_DN2466_c1_g1_i4.p1  ORF type:complete len:689 (-),score=31.43 TRINITY_DN2466_c1_g1_i4:284-2350(-)
MNEDSLVQAICGANSLQELLRIINYCELNDNTLIVNYFMRLDRVLGNVDYGNYGEANQGHLEKLFLKILSITNKNLYFMNPETFPLILRVICCLKLSVKMDFMQKQKQQQINNIIYKFCERVSLVADEMEVGNILQCLNYMVKLKYNYQKHINIVFDSLCNRDLQIVKNMRKTLKIISLLCYQNQENIQKIINQIMQQNHFENEDIQKILRTLCFLKFNDNQLIEKLVNQLRRPRNFQAKEIIFILVSLSNLQYQDNYIINYLIRLVANKNISSQFLFVNLFYVMGKYNYQDKNTLNHFIQQLFYFDNYQPQQISSIISSLAILSYTDQEIYDFFSKLILQNNDFTQNEICDILRAFGRVAYKNQKTINHLLNLQKNMNEKDAKIIVSSLHGLFQLNFNQNVEAIQQLLDNIKINFNQLDFECVVNLLFYLQKLRFYDPKILIMIEEFLLKMNFELNQINCEQILRIFGAFSNFGICNKKQIILKFVKILNQTKDWPEKKFASIIYALCILEVPLIIIQKLINKFLKNNYQNIDNFHDITFSQICWAQIVYFNQEPNLKLPKYFENQCKLKRIKYVREFVKTPVQSINVIFEYLQNNNISCEKQAIVEQGLLNVSIKINYKQQKIALFVFTRSQYAINNKKKLLNQAQAALKILQRLGWVVFEVSSQEFILDENYRKQLLIRIQKCFV